MSRKEVIIRKRALLASIKAGKKKEIKKEEISEKAFDIEGEEPKEIMLEEKPAKKKVKKIKKEEKSE